MRVRAKKVTIDNIVFDSGMEGDRYLELKLLQRIGEITKLQCHPIFRFEFAGVKIGFLKPDFQYLDKRNAVVVEDVKGWRTTKPSKRFPRGQRVPRVDRGFNIKKKLMLACFGIDVKIV